MPDKIPLLVASDANYFYGLQTSVASAIVHERAHALHVHLLDTGLHDRQWQALVATATRLNPQTELTRHPISSSTLSSFKTFQHLNATTYARLLAPDFVPGPYAVYVDSDFLFVSPVSSILPHLASNKAIAAAQQGPDDRLSDDCPWSNDPALKERPYINAGILLLNLDRWRADDISGTLLSFLAKESDKCKHCDQTAINWILKDDVDYLPMDQNVIMNNYDWGMSGPIGQINLHYLTGMKPWSRRLPMLSHQAWWLFNRMFPPAAPPPNPLRHPRDLARYLRYRAKLRFQSPKTLRPKHTLDDWKNFYRNLGGKE